MTGLYKNAAGEAIPPDKREGSCLYESGGSDAVRSACGGEAGLIRRIRRKLSGTSGESISETLVALLIASLALTMLAGAITSSFSVVTKSRQKLKSYYESAENLVEISEESEGGTDGSVTVTLDGNTLGTYPVVVAENREFERKPVAAYKYSGDGD